MTEFRDKWMKGMIKRHGSEEAVRAFMRESRSLSRGNKTNNYFTKLKQENPKLLKSLSDKGVKARGHNGKNTREQEGQGQ